MWFSGSLVDWLFLFQDVQPTSQTVFIDLPSPLWSFLAVMTPQSVIRRKRDGEALSADEMEFFVKGVVSGNWSRGQTGSMLMALFQRGLNLEETSVLLQEMLSSGDRLDMHGLQAPVADKHSTGGVGDKVSLVLAPLAATCGLAIPMLSGRGLGHTGGTLDKLEAIPGFRVFLSPAEIRKQVKEIGCVIAGQTESIVPADKILYAMRDETATVEHPSLVAASILSKKLAEDLQVLLLDVKFGRGAFFKEIAEAEHLACLMVDLGKAAGCRVAAWLTCMDDPLGRAVGNAVEVEECIAILKGEGPDALTDLICQEVAGMLVLSGLHDSHEVALKSAVDQLHNGAALERFRQMIIAQGGIPDIVDDPSLLPQSPYSVDILHEEGDTVWVSGVDAGMIADVVLETGAGRQCAEDNVDHSVGLSSLVTRGDKLEPGDLICRLYHPDPARAGGWEERIRKSIATSPERISAGSLIHKKIS